MAKPCHLLGGFGGLLPRENFVLDNLSYTGAYTGFDKGGEGGSIHVIGLHSLTSKYL